MSLLGYAQHAAYALHKAECGTEERWSDCWKLPCWEGHVKTADLVIEAEWRQIARDALNAHRSDTGCGLDGYVDPREEWERQQPLHLVSEPQMMSDRR